jgi:hypothetical protein
MAEIRIDSSGLTFTKFSVSGHSPHLVDGAGTPVLSLVPGVYGIEQLPRTAGELRIPGHARGVRRVRHRPGRVRPRELRILYPANLKERCPIDRTLPDH